MASKSNSDPVVDPAHIPTSIIQQAEAAIVGNFDDDFPIERRSSRVPKPDYSLYQTKSRGGASKSKHLGVPSGDAPPAYGDNESQIELSQDGFDTKAKVTDDGRINININQKTRKLSDLLVPALRQQLSLVAQEEETPLPPGYIPPALGGLPGQTPPPKLNVVIHVVGSRGDVQPFVALGKILKSTYGHRVRLATHPTFKGFVEENGLEFFSIGGDPSELMAFMVKNPGLMPGFDSLKSGDVGKRRKGMEEIVLGCWRSCIEAGDGLGPAPPRRESSDSFGLEGGINMESSPGDRPFIADAIIANPPSFAHIHIAEKLGIPLHMMFTMPWSPTQSFPHPLANIQSSNTDVNIANFVSYALVEMMTWQGLGDVINRFRERALGLDPISLIWAPGMLSRLRVPYTYCWSPALIPKPKDWGQHISISGFYFLSLASSFTPEAALAAYLAAGPPPVYIGFGSIVVDDPDGMTKLIFEAVKKAGVRALVSKGWGGLGADDLGIPEGVFMLGNVPHDWLFQHVACVVHHGGAGTTAAGIATGRPTVVVPFFGDQPFWGAMVARAGAGPPPIPYKQLTAENLAAALTEALRPETLTRAQELGALMKEEKGTEIGGKAFHDMLDVDTLRCALSPSRAAVWRIKRTQTRLSALAANILASQGLIDFADLKLYRPREYETEEGPWDPISGGASALLGTIASLSMGVADFPIEIFKKVRKRHDTFKESKERASEDSTPQGPSRTDSIDLAPEETDEPKSYFEGTETPRQENSTTSTTPKTSYESTGRSLSDATSPTETPLSSTTSLNTHKEGAHRGNSLKQALSGALNRSRSQSRDRNGRSSSKDRLPGSRSGSPFRRRETKEFDPSQLTIENATRATKGAARIVVAGLKSPMDFTLGIARGFHNAPKLYGDDTVRPQAKVTDFQSGLKAAGKEFGYGFYDGITGLVTQPLRGAEKEGAAGLLKGIGKGIGGLVLKPGAAIWGLPGYAFMGVNKEIQKLFGSSVLNYIIAARTAQGYEDAQFATPEERLDIIHRWKEHKAEYQNMKMKLEEQGGPDGQERGRLTPKGFMQTRHLSFEDRKKLHEDRKVRREEERQRAIAAGEHNHCPFCRRSTTHSHTPRAVQTTPIVLDKPNADQDEQFEHAIHASVAATSRGNPEEDMMIERAIRASVRELQAAQGSKLSDQEALERAIQASVAEGRRRRSDEEVTSPATAENDLEHQALLEKAIQQSLAEYHLPNDEGDVDTDEDENVKLALRLSKEEPAPDDEEGMVQAALEKSKAEHEHKEGKAKSEEQAVLDYVKKMSLAEQQQAASAILEGKRREAKDPERTAEQQGESEADAEALRLAIEASLKGAGGGEASGT
ncbi:glycosyltransferase family 1 protein [Hyaloscypha variabilis]|uniref:Glycosyltransferase family 1 protein n=1 Tax=Hyaloscypha variabilis (strain UAMH 11265 / GT02V1 / F) TaxID=1149755 RepID=A0A2J6RHT8_HYAVF|nr:glycosyltransferase family 1 protein [Hyaloscypha variabilis F]